MWAIKKKDLKLAFPNSLWYQLSTSNTLRSHCKLHDKPTWNKRIHISKLRDFQGEVESKLVHWVSFTRVNVWLTKIGFLYSCGVSISKNDSRGANSFLGDFLQQNLEGKGSSTSKDTPIYLLRKTMSFILSRQYKTCTMQEKKSLSSIKSIWYFTHEWKTVCK